MTSDSPTGPETRSIVIAAGGRDAEERVIDAPDRAEQADEGRRAADRGEQHLAELQLAAGSGAGRRAGAASAASRRGRAPRACRSAAPRGRRRRSGRSTPSRSKAASCARPASSDGAAQNAGTARSQVEPDAAQQPALPEDHHPGADRHQQQQRRDAARDRVALGPEMLEAGARHRPIVASPSTCSMPNSPDFWRKTKRAARKLPSA